jgi:hypothetical protein
MIRGGLLLTTAVFCCALTLVLLSAAAYGIDKTYWQGAPGVPGDWFDGTNWTAGVPTENCWSYIDNGGIAAFPAGHSLDTGTIYLGYSASGMLVQEGGQLGAGITCGRTAPGAVGTFRLVEGECTGGFGVSGPGTGIFEQSGGVASFYRIGNDEGHMVLRLNGGSFSASRTQLGVYTGGSAHLEIGGSANVTLKRLELGGGGSVQVTQTGGTLTISGSGYEDAGGLSSHASYRLSGGTLTAEAPFRVGNRYGTATDCRMSQNGGVAEFEHLQVTEGALYEFTNGTLRVRPRLTCSGRFDFQGSHATLDVEAGSIFDFGQADLANSSSASIEAAENTLVILPEGFSPDTDLGSYHSSGITHFEGTPLEIPAGVETPGYGRFRDPVHVRGTIHAWDNEDWRLVFENGLSVYDGGNVHLGRGCVELQQGSSVMEGGIVTGHLGLFPDARMRFWGEAGEVPVFHQTGGTVQGLDIQVGWDDDYTGRYVLEGDGEIVRSNISVAGDGAEFVQNGGQLTDCLEVYVGADTDGALSSYSLTDGSLNSYDLHVDGRGYMEQTDSTVDVHEMVVGSYYNRPAEYVLNSGELRAVIIWTHDGDSHRFVQRGGTVTAEELHVGGKGTYYSN